MAKKRSGRSEGPYKKATTRQAKECPESTSIGSEQWKCLNWLVLSVMSQLATEMITAGILIEGTEGVPVYKDGQTRLFRLRDDPSDKDTQQFAALLNVAMLFETREDAPYFERGGGFIIGVLAGWAITSRMTSQDIASLNKLIENLTHHRTLGGLAKRKLTPEVEILAKRYIAAELRPSVSKTAACNRAAARLNKEHSIDISGKTLMPLVDAAIRENAEQSPK